MRSAILPFRPVLRDFLRNLWALRLFLTLIVLAMQAASAGAERLMGASPSVRAAWPLPWVGLLDLLRSFCSSLLVGLLVWVVQQSLAGHNLVKARWLLFPTQEDA